MLPRPMKPIRSRCVAMDFLAIIPNDRAAVRY
jgi:hypothetical protein